MKELLEIIRSYGMYVGNYDLKKLYYVGFSVGWLKHRVGRIPKCVKARKKKRLVIDEPLLKRWIDNKMGIVPEGYKTKKTLAEEYGYKESTFKKFIYSMKKNGFPISKIRVGRWMYYNEQEFKSLWLSYKYRYK